MGHFLGDVFCGRIIALTGDFRLFVLVQFFGLFVVRFFHDSILVWQVDIRKHQVLCMAVECVLRSLDNAGLVTSRQTDTYRLNGGFSK